MKQETGSDGKSDNTRRTRVVLETISTFLQHSFHRFQDVEKLQTHLELLRGEYVKLQQRHAELEKQYEVAVATAGVDGQDAPLSFPTRLLKFVQELFDNKNYSDLTVKLMNRSLFGHKFVFAARSEKWNDLSEVTELDLSDFSEDVGYALIQWVYTGDTDMKNEDNFHLNLLKAARKFDLVPLSDRCEQALMSSVNVKNCIRFYQTADEIGAENLKQHCSQLISTHWEDFTSEDFDSMPAPLAYKMFKSKTQFPLHTAIRTKREDVVFLYLVEHDSKLPAKLEEADNHKDVPLDLALRLKCEGIANTLVKHKVDVNSTDHTGACLLHRAIARGDDSAAKFLINNEANINAVSLDTQETALHLVAGFQPEKLKPETIAGATDVARLLLEKGASGNRKDSSGNTPLHKAISARNTPVFKVLLSSSDLDLELKNNEGHTVFGLALYQAPPGGEFGEESYAVKLLQKGSSVDAVNQSTGDSLLHSVSRVKNEASALFLVSNGANVTLYNKKGETALHTACMAGLSSVARALLTKGANPNAQTVSPLSETSSVSKQTPLHLAVQHRHVEVIQIFLQFKAEVTSGSGSSLQIIPNFTVKDSEDQTVLALALWNGLHDVAVQLLKGGASVNDCNSEGLTLLHQAIMKEDTDSALFLLLQGADCNRRTQDKKTPLELSIKHCLPLVVEQLCEKQADLNLTDESGDCPLWQALESQQENIASILVRQGCDVDMWGAGPENCQQTLLHKAIDENNETIACFLIRSGCDVNSPRRAGPSGGGGDEAYDGHTPLHLCCTWGLENVVQCLLEHQAHINAQDRDGKCPLHIAIESQHPGIISLLLGTPEVDLLAADKKGLTPFAAAMLTKNNKAAQTILDREPHCAEQYDSKGRNFLHTAIMKNNIESVLFLLSIHVNVNSHCRDSSQMSPLHLAVQAGSEMIVRNLLLAGAAVNELTPRKKSALHIACERDDHVIAQILLENHIQFDALDDSLNNALHIACQLGHSTCVRVLLTESRINAEAVNMRGQNPMHILGQYGKDNAAAIFDLFMECMPEYPIDKPDINGNTVLLWAYFNGNGTLCRAVVKAGASLGVVNKDGVTIFNAPVATRQLLFKLLDMLHKEPPWSEGEVCLECGVRFSIKTRKHHCRHCGRLLCSKCSGKDMPIIKYSITKPVRVCETCFDVLSYGALN